jgi:hypothetical protein
MSGGPPMSVVAVLVYPLIRGDDVENLSSNNTRRLYFADAIPGHSDAGQEVLS